MEIIFENKDFLVLNKEAGLLSIPARGSLINEESCYSILKEKYGQIYTVHRLDKETSGILLFAKNEIAHRNLSLIFEKHLTEKKYIAFVYGDIKENTGEINKRIKEFSKRVAIDFNGKDSLTKYLVKERFEKYTLLELTLITGRRHQIRVHLYSIGHPIVGDLSYGDIKEQKKYPRLMLHSYYLSFNYQGENYSFKLNPDNNFYSIIKTLV